MAVRRQDLEIGGDAVVVEFPFERRQAGVRRQQATVRRRRVVASVGAAAAAALLLMGEGPQASVAPSKAAPSSVVIQPGDTLWELASRYAPSDSDPRAYIQSIITLNDLDGALEAGDKIKLPE